MIFNTKFKNDNIFFSVSPLVLLYWLNNVDNIKKILILQVCLSSLIYWNYKNIYTFSFDVYSACLFIFYLLYILYRERQNVNLLVYSITISIFWIWSFWQGQHGQRQVVNHLIFRLIVLLLFLQTEKLL